MSIDVNEFFKKSLMSDREKQKNLLNSALKSDKIVEDYINKSNAECKEVFSLLDKCIDYYEDKHKPNIDANETNISLVLNFLLKILSLCNNKYGLLAQNELHKKVSGHICTKVMSEYLNRLIKKCLSTKLNSKDVFNLQIACIKLLKQCILENKSNLKQISIEFSYFQDKKNFLFKYINQNNSYNLRKESIKFLFSFLNHINDIETQLIVRKIFFQQTSIDKTRSTSSSSSPYSANLIQNLFQILIYCKFNLIEFVLEELLLKIIKNQKFSKSDKIKLFNERNLINLLKLYNWRHRHHDSSNDDTEDEEDEEDDRRDEEDESQNLIKEATLYEMLTEFLKLLFCSTQYGINFYDRTLAIDLNNAANNNISNKNLNHLLFNSLISVQSFFKNEQIKLYDDLLLRTFKVCPDLIQRYFKYKYKQIINQQQQQQHHNESDNANITNSDNKLTLNWLLDLMIKLFEQQKGLISKGYFLDRYYNANDLSLIKSNESASNYQQLIDHLCELIIQTSVPVTIPIARLLQQQQQQQLNFKCIQLLINSLNCLNEWKLYLNKLKSFKAYSNINVNKILISLNRQLFLNKYIPTIDQLNQFYSNQNNEFTLFESSEIVKLIDLFILYFDLLLLKNDDDDDYNKSDYNNQDINNQQICDLYLNKSFLFSLSNLILNKKLDDGDNQLLYVKYLKFLLYFLKLKQLYDLSETFEAIINELIYKLIKLLIKYGYYNSETVLNNYVNFVQISFDKLILNIEGDEINAGKRFNLNLYQLWFILFYKNASIHNENDSELNFFIDYADCCLKKILNFKLNNLFNDANDMDKMFLQIDFDSKVAILIFV